MKKNDDFDEFDFNLGEEDDLEELNIEDPKEQQPKNDDDNLNFDDFDM